MPPADVWVNEKGDDPRAQWQDVSPLNRKIFFFDNPGTDNNAANNLGIAPPNDLVGLDWLTDFRSYVEVDGRVVSNKLEWAPHYSLEVKAGDNTWSVKSKSCN